MFQLISPMFVVRNHYFLWHAHLIKCWCVACYIIAKEKVNVQLQVFFIAFLSWAFYSVLCLCLSLWPSYYVCCYPILVFQRFFTGCLYWIPLKRIFPRFFCFPPALRLSLNLSLWYSFSVCCFPFLSFFLSFQRISLSQLRPWRRLH